MKPDFGTQADSIYALLGRGSEADAKAIERALRSTWNAALEEAAGVAIGHAGGNALGFNYDYSWIGERIRALKVPHG